MRNKMNIKYFLMALSLISYQAFAQFNVADDEYFGNGEIRPFKDAIEGTETIQPEEMAYLNAVDITRTINRWYFRFFFGNPRMKLNEIGNTSSGDFIGLVPGQNENTQYLYNVTFAGGKVWNQWALELELYFMKELKFEISPAYYMVPGNSKIKINQAAAFINVQYIIPRMFSWYPKRLQLHFDGGAGVSYRMADLDLFLIDGSQVGSGSERTIAPSANLGVGFRYQLTASLLFDLAYRYFFFGKTNIGPALASITNPAYAGLFQNPSVEYQSSKFQANGFFLGVTYQV